MTVAEVGLRTKRTAVLHLVGGVFALVWTLVLTIVVLSTSPASPRSSNGPFYAVTSFLSAGALIARGIMLYRRGQEMSKVD